LEQVIDLLLKGFNFFRDRGGMRKLFWMLGALQFLCLSGQQGMAARSIGEVFGAYAAELFHQLKG
jgi:hypothetical protein